ncbi:undecaprenyl-phosphate glucose phosphotransferase [Staphylococcus gallinarum]|uniref:Undecaprenyl-phosphate glucose phosphotransferase n=1 Tax=Staphylococcus gallinarum TaxID=1293 RepID=A0A380FBK8_STAGA|nr:undecaprenyl-phosphate glucose phosphotransferase [Staphylococcus gallinarum]
MPFEIFKFRTMTDEKDSHGELLPDDQRMTKLGAAIRKNKC